MIESKGKIRFIATARCIGILLVIFGHSFPFGVHIPSMLTEINQFIYTFHMPLFLFLSGYLLTRNTKPAGEYIRRRGRRLLIPYFVLSIVAFVPKVLVQQFLNDSVELSIWYLIKTELIPRDNVWGHFWYIPVVFFLGCFGVAVLPQMRKHWVIRAAVLSAAYILLFAPRITDWFALEDIRKTAFYFVFGMTAADCDQDARMVAHKAWLFALPGAVILYAIMESTLTNSIIACLMIGFILHIGTWLPVGRTGPFVTIEKNSFSIFLLSWPAQAVIEVICNKLLHFPVLLTIALMFLAGISVPLICVKLIEWLEKYIPMKWVKLAIGM